MKKPFSNRKKPYRHYTLDRLDARADELKAEWRFPLGEKGNGKTTAILMKAIKRYLDDGYEIGYVRRWKDQVEGAGAKQTFTGLEKIKDEDTGKVYNWIEKVTKGKYNTTYFYSDRWYFAFVDEDFKMKKAPKPFAYAFGLSTEDRYSSRAYPDIRTIFYDEFLTTGMYLKNEWALFTKLCQTILRDNTFDDGVRVYMACNTVDFASPNFLELGVDALSLKQGEITAVKYEDGPILCIEYCDTAISQGGRKIDKMYNFGNVMSDMILTGKWAMFCYPHLLEHYTFYDVSYTFYIVYLNRTLKCNIVRGTEGYFMDISKFERELERENGNEIIFTQEDSISPYYRKNLWLAEDDVGKTIKGFFLRDKVFYQDNETGTIVKRYLDNCKAGTL